jgi:hypothetical protein
MEGNATRSGRIVVRGFENYVQIGSLKGGRNALTLRIDNPDAPLVTAARLKTGALVRVPKAPPRMVATVVQRPPLEAGRRETVAVRVEPSGSAVGSTQVMVTATDPEGQVVAKTTREFAELARPQVVRMDVTPPPRSPLLVQAHAVSDVAAGSDSASFVVQGPEREPSGRDRLWGALFVGLGAACIAFGVVRWARR